MCCAADWMRGAVCVKDVEGEVRLELMGGGPIESEVSVVGQFFPGVVRLSAVQGGAFFVRASNQLAFSFAGPGSCGVERFEQQVIGAGLGDDGLSRMILNINEGRMIVDSRAVPSMSRLIFEMPVGRILAQNALWSLSLAYEPQSRRHHFAFECAEGLIRYTCLLYTSDAADE